MAARNVQNDAEQVFKVLENGGAAIIPLDVAYAIFGHSADSIRRIYAAKGRSFTKPNGTLGNLEIFNEIHIAGDREKEIVRAITADHGLPLSVVAPFRADHPFLKELDPFVLERSTKAGTLDILLNAGVLHDALAEMSMRRMFPIVGSSANISLAGSKFRLQDVEEPILKAAEITIDYGLSKYHNPQGVSSTIIDLRDFTVVREGVCFARIAEIMRADFGIELRRAA